MSASRRGVFSPVTASPLMSAPHDRTPKNVANSLRLDFRVPSAPEDARPATPGQAGSPSATSRRRLAVGFPSRISRTHANRAGVARRRPRPRTLRRAETPADGMSNKRCAQTSASSPTLCANNSGGPGAFGLLCSVFFSAEGKPRLLHRGKVSSILPLQGLIYQKTDTRQPSGHTRQRGHCSRLAWPRRPFQAEPHCSRPTAATEPATDSGR